MAGEISVGRNAERALLASRLSEGRSVLLAGGSGVGKTHLARGLMRDAWSDGRRVEWLAATESSRALSLSAIAPLVPADARRDPGALSAAEILQIVRASLADDAVEPPLVVFDDVQHFDDASATVVHQLVTTGSVTAILTLTTAQPTPAAFTALWKDGFVDRVDLHPLPRRETQELIAALLGGRPAPMLVQSLWEATLGNPLYLCELVDAARRDGSIVWRNERWMVSSSLPVNGRLVELVGARVSALSPAGRDALTLVAFADPLQLHLAERLVGPDALADAEEHRVVEVVDLEHRAFVRPVHPVYGEVARSLLTSSRRRALSRELADGLESTGLRRRDDELRYITWRLDAHDPAPVELLVRSAWRASHALDHDLAERLARAALGADPGNGLARLALADSLYRLHRHDEALAVLEASPPANDERQRTELAWLQAKVLWFGLDRVEAADDVLARAESSVTDPTCRAWLGVYRSRFRVALGYPIDTITYATPITERDDLDPQVRLLALGALATGLAFAGRSHDAVTISEAARRLQHDTPGRAHIVSGWIVPATWVASLLAGELAPARAAAAALRTHGLEQQHQLSVTLGTVGLAWVDLLGGDVRRAADLLGDATEVEFAEDWNGVRSLALAGLAWAHAFQGDLAAANDALDLAESAMKRGTRWFAPLIAMARAWTTAAGGDRDAALRQFATIADETRERSQAGYEVLARHAIARLGRPREVTDRLDQLAGHVQGPFAAAASAHAAALAARDADALEAVAETFEQLDLVLLASDAWGAGCRFHTANGDLVAAEAAGARGASLRSRCCGVRAPIVENVGAASLLTVREAEVARFAASGATSREIAERLHVSIRTVDAHLAHIYSKLRIQGRHELPAALDPQRQAS